MFLASENIDFTGLAHVFLLGGGEGIAIAKAHGRYKGRAPIRLDSQRFEAVYARYHTREISKKEMARLLGISRPTLDRLLEEFAERADP